MEQTHLTKVRFDQFNLHTTLLSGLADAGFVYCTPIQAAALPIALAGKDVAGQAQTGTGKTAAFLLAMMNYLLNRPPHEARKPTQPRAMVLAPTRELAIQINRDALQLGRHTNFKIELVYGGVDYLKQRENLQQGVDILIGTPGRLIDYFKQDVFDLRQIEVAVLDEADRMFDLGFIKDVRYIFRRMSEPTERLNMLFSATLSQRVHELAYEHMNQPQEVEVTPDRKTADLVTQIIYHVESKEKIGLLIGLLRRDVPTRTLVFVNTKRAGENLEAHLRANDLKARCLTGDVPQRKRQQLIHQFVTGELPVLVATDVAARGLHIPEVSHVINFDLPQNAEDYVHRIGRTARAGESGDAISLACEEYVYSLMEIESFLGHRLPVGALTPDIIVDAKQPDRRSRSQGGPGSHRGRVGRDKRRSSNRGGQRVS